MADAGIRHTWNWGMPTMGSTKSYNVDENELAGVRPESSVADSIRKFSSLGSVKDGFTPEKPKQKAQSLAIDEKLVSLRQGVTTARNEFLDIRQEASDLQEYCNAKIARVTRYLGVLAEKARKSDQVALDCEERLNPLKEEKKKLFNDLVSIKGNIRVFVRVRPQFEHETQTITSFPSDFTVRISNAGSTNKKEFEFDRVYGPHVGQGELFEDVQPLVQSALDGYNVAVFGYGQTGAGKTYTMEGTSQDRGLYFRTFEKLFELANADYSTVARYTISLTLFELHNEQVRDLLRLSSTTEHHKGFPTIQMGYGSQFVELVELRLENPSDFARAFKMAMQNRALDASKSERTSRSHLVLTAHVQLFSSICGIKQYSKFSLVDMAGSERLSSSEAGNRLTESLHVHKSLSALGDVVSSLTAKKENIPYGNSKLTQILSDSMGGKSKTLIIINLSPSYSDMEETISSLNFAARARNVELSLGNRDTIKKWRDMANDVRKELLEKEKEASGLQQEVFNLKKALKESEDQCLLLFNEVQKAWKVTFDLQADIGAQESHINKLKIECAASVAKEQMEKENNLQLQMQIAELTKIDKDQHVELIARAEKIQVLKGKLEELQKIVEKSESVSRLTMNAASVTNKGDFDVSLKSRQENESVLAVNKRLEEELCKRDELIERLHEENEKLFERLTDRNAAVGSPKVSRRTFSGLDDVDLDGSFRSQNKLLLPGRKSSTQIDRIPGKPAPAGTIALFTGSEKIKTTPAGEYLTSALMDFNPDQYEGPAAVADGANKLLMLVLAAVIKAGAVREHEMLAEIREAVFLFIRKLEPRKLMDTMLVSRVRILYIRSLLSRAAELQSIKVPPVEQFLSRSESSRGSSRGSSPLKSPSSHELSTRGDSFDDNFQTFKVYFKQEKKSKFSSLVLKLRGINQETWRQHVTGAKLRETSEEARSFAVGNKKLASLFVHTPAGELQRQIRAWLAENFDFFTLTGGESIGGVTGHLELLSTTIMDGWMAGLGTPARPSTDALGQLLAEYTKRVYSSQLQHLKDLSATLATEEAEDLPQINKLRSALESVEHKRRKILQQMRTDVALLKKDEGGSPLRNPSTATEDARVASLISLEDIVRQAEEIKMEAQQKNGSANECLDCLSELSKRLPALLSIDHPCALHFIAQARKFIESLPAQRDESHHTRAQSLSDETQSPDEVSHSSSLGGLDFGIQQWSILQFNNGLDSPFMIKCGATLSSELVIKAQEKVGNNGSKEIIATAPLPSSLSGLPLEGIRKQLSTLPEPLIQLALAKTADGTRARYARLYKTLASRVPALSDISNY